MTKAVVLGGGGLAGIAWELGVLQGLADHGLSVSDAGLVVGTSAGATVGAQITSGRSLQALYDDQVDPPAHSVERMVDIDLPLLARIFAELADAAPGLERTAALARVGSMALSVSTPSQAERRAIIASRIPSDDWPSVRLIITAVDARTGSFVPFDRYGGVGLVDAVTASSAVPGVWPPVAIGTRRFIDGGMRSPTNADLASGCQQVLVLAPMTSVLVDQEVALLHRAGATVRVITPDQHSQQAFGTNPLDPSCKSASALAGRVQGASIVDQIKPFWHTAPARRG